MKLRPTIFTAIGVAIATAAGFFFILSLKGVATGRNHLAEKYPILVMVILGFELALAIGIGVPSAINLACERPIPRLTRIMIVTAVFSIVLIPYGIWGIFELRTENKTRRRTQRRGREPVANAAPVASDSTFTRQAARFSWISAAATIVLGLVFGASHDRAIIYTGFGFGGIGFLASLIAGIYALFGVHEHGKRGILLPALAGTVVSSFFLLFVLAAFTAGVIEGAKDRAHQKLHATTRETAAKPANPAAPGP